METKKNANKDLTLQRKKFFMIGLSISLALVITAFEWKTEKKKPTGCHLPYPKIEDVQIISEVRTIDYPKPPALKMEKIKLEPKPVNPIELIPVDNDKSVADPTPSIDQYLGADTEAVVFADKPEPADSIFVIAEFNPEPRNGYANFYKDLGKSIKYPMQAQRTGTEGKVFVQFVVSKTGEPTDLKITKGIGAGCDEEAMRVIGKTKWEPGRQRGQPVRVRMTLPVYFQLSN
jgi:protein TonB